MPAVTDTAVLITSELVTNAVQATAEHDGNVSPPAITLRLTCISTRLLIEVWDRDEHLPHREQSTGAREHGRGLMIVEALSLRWAYYRRPQAPGKVIWCQIEIPIVLETTVSVPPAPRTLPRRALSRAPLIPSEFSEDPAVLQRVADGLRALDWNLPDG